MRNLSYILAIIVTCMCALPSSADGKYFARYDFENDPTIPAQRAIVRWKDNIETLVVESIVESGGEEVGWILPLPAEPSEIVAVTPGTIETLQVLVQPEIRSGQSLQIWNVLLAISFVIVAIWCINTAGGVKIHDWGVLFFLILMVFTCAGVLLPAIGTARGGGSVSSIEILRSARVGSYEVHVITAKDASEIQDWLDQNGFRCPDDAVPVIADYIKDGWCFATAKIAHDAEGSMSPHPLKVTFPTDEPVYPMRLTGVTDETLQLDLYVIADQTARVEGLETWWSGSFLYDPVVETVIGIDVAGYTDADQRIRIGHPEVSALMWDSCVLTHLRGELDPVDMKNDLRIEQVPLRVTRRVLYSAGGAIQLLLMFGLIAGMIGWIVLASRAPDRGALRWFIKHVIGFMIGIALLGVFVIYVVLPVHPVKEGMHPVHLLSRGRQIMVAIEYIAEEISRDENDQHDIREYLRSHEYFVGGNPDEWMYDIPGGCLVQDTDDGWRVGVYGMTGAPIHLLISREGDFVIEEDENGDEEVGGN